MSQLLILEEDSASSDSPHVLMRQGKDAQDATLEFTRNQFEQTYQRAPHYVARAPGRVNLIGEHIDYNGFGVLPMALEQSVFVACSTEGAAGDSLTLDIQSTSPGANPCRYHYKVDQIVALFSKPEETTAPFDATNKDWSHYVLCAFFGVMEYLVANSNSNPSEQLSGQKLSLLIHGTVPQGAGVSSSSALVVSSALAFLALLQQLGDKKITKPQIAQLCARCERWVGTEGGGMDQAISIFAQQGSGRYIQFQPTFQHQAIPLPDNANWVVCHSLEESHKRHDAATLFNKRVVECKIGCLWLAKALMNPDHQSNYPTLLWDLVHQSKLSLEELETIAAENVPETCSKDELIKFVQQGDTTTSTDLKALASKLGITRPAGVEVLELADSFCVRDRLLHVLSEARRVQEFVALCCCSGQSNDAQGLGSLMNQSHNSCSKLYDCSSSQLDQLQTICLQAPGAVGSRMTGAGWGGCVISLVLTEQVEAFCNHVRAQYYATLPSDVTSNKDEADYLFVTKPSQGSNMFEFCAV